MKKPFANCYLLIVIFCLLFALGCEQPGRPKEVDAPPPSEPARGLLQLEITPPAGLSLDVARSRARIEQDGPVPLNGEGWTWGERAIDAAFSGDISLTPGRYVVDILLAQALSGTIAHTREEVAVTADYAAEVGFSPPAEDFLDPAVLASVTEGGEVVGLTRRPPFTPRKIPGTSFC